MPVDRRTFLRGAGGLGAAGALAGCLGDDETSIALWHGLGPDETTVFDRQVEQFVEDTGQTVTTRQTDDLEEQLETSVPTGQGPELFGWAHDWMGDFVERDFLFDASDSVSVDLDGTFVGVAADAARFDGGIYGLPYAAETVALLYDRTAVTSAPATVEELTDAMDEYDGRHGLAASVDPYTISGWLHAGDGFYYDDDSGDIGVAETDTVEALRFYRDTLWEYQPDNPDYDAQMDAFRNGNAAFAIAGPRELDLEDATIDREDVGVAPLPRAPIGDPSPYVAVQLWFFSDILTQTAGGGFLEGLLPGGGEETTAVDLAVSFTEWYTTNAEVATTNAEENTFVPVLDEVAAEYRGGGTSTPEGSRRGAIGAYTTSVRTGTPIPKAADVREIWQPLNEAIRSVLTDGADPQDALTEANDNIETAIEERNEDNSVSS